MTGAYVRVKRDGKWVNVEVEYMTSEEREVALEGRELQWLNRTCEVLAETFPEDTKYDN